MPLSNHLYELRYRVIVAIAAVLAGAVIVFYKMKDIYVLLTAPLGGGTLHFIGPADGFITLVEIALVGGVILGWPVLLYQVLAFILPGTQTRERKIILACLVPGVILFTVGVFFGNQVIFPLILKFFLNAGEDYLSPMLIGSKYFSFLLLLTFAMGVVFEIPLVLFLLGHLGFINSNKLRATRMYGYVGILLVVGFFIPTPDIFTLLSVSAPVLVLYESSIWILYLAEKLQHKEDTQYA